MNCKTLKCGSCFYFRRRMAGGFNGTTHCNNIAQKIEINGELGQYGYYDIDSTQQACKRYRNDKQERQKRIETEKSSKKKIKKRGRWC